MDLNPATHILFDIFLNQFAARTDGYVKDSGVHITGELTPNVVAEAFSLGHSISGYMARRDREGVVRTHIGAIDFDSGQPMDTLETQKTLMGHGIKTLRVQSRRGFHLWVFADAHQEGVVGEHTVWTQLPAEVMSRALNHALRLTVPELHASGKAEVFPKMTNGDWPGGTLRMPMMTHPKTGERYPVYDDEGEPIPTLTDLMTYVAGLTTPASAFQRLGQMAPVTYPKALTDHAAPRAEYDGPSISQLLFTMGIDALPGRATHCPFHPDKRKSLSIAKDDQRAWCKAPACPIYNDDRGVGSMQLRQMLEARP